jgi:hypothetical protein
MELDELTARLVRAEARVLALMSIAAAMLKHHPERDEIEATLGQLAELHESALLPKTHQDAVGEVYRSTTVRVQQLSRLAL